MKRLILKIAVMLIAIVGLAWFIVPISHNVLNIGNIAGIAVCYLVFLVCAFSGVIKKISEKSKPFRVFYRAALFLFCAGVVWAAFLTGCMLFGANTFGGSPIPKNATVVVLGSKASGTVPSADLMVRINKAAEYLKANAQAKCIVSGGQGAGEAASEAAIMKTYLVKQGIDASRISEEGKSTSTQENIHNSLQLIKKNGLSQNLAIVTDEYHEYRACKIARDLGAVPYAVSAQTPWYILSACYVRELLALTKEIIIP